MNSFIFCSIYFYFITMIFFFNNRKFSDVENLKLCFFFTPNFKSFFILEFLMLGWENLLY